MPRKLRATAADTQPTTAVETIKKKFTKEKLHKFMFGTRERQGLGQQIAVYGLLIIIGFMVGSVIFQKHSQPEPPSIFAASYNAGSTFCNAERKIRI